MISPYPNASPPPVLGSPALRVQLRKRLSAKPFSLFLAGINPWLTLFLVATFLFQVMLIPQALYPLRTYLRVALFASSLAMILIVPGRFRWTALTYLAIAITCIFCVQLLHPENNSPLAAMAAIALNFAILSPIFWVSRLRLDPAHMRFLLLLLWAFNALSSCLGILEVYYPARFSRDSKIAVAVGAEMAEGLKVTLANGTAIYRPMGFTDSPGGAALSGYMTILIASGLLLTRCGPALGAACLVSIVGGMFCIYICQVRSILLISLICEIVMLGVVALRGKIFRVSGLLLVIPMLIAAATIWAFAVGGEQVQNRISTLTEGKAGQVYYANRGIFLEDTVLRLLPQYPLGAGLGRWGMINLYFGDRANTASKPIWAEIQPTAWLLDGGVFLVLCYYLVVFLCIGFAFRIAVFERDLIADLATLVVALDVATLATTFGSIPFISQSGLTFWLINSALLAVVLRHTQKASMRKSMLKSITKQLGIRPSGQPRLRLSLDTTD